MRIKVSLRYLNRLFNVGHIKVHDVFSDTLAPETMEALSEKFHTLSEFAEATDKELMAIPGVSEKTSSTAATGRLKKISNNIEENTFLYILF